MKKKYGIIGGLLILIILIAVIALGIRAKNNYWTLISYPDDSGNNGMFYTMKNHLDGTLIVVDGGWPENTQKVRDTIMANGGTVDAWILTHYHMDHVSAFNAIYADTQGIEIKEIYASPYDYDFFKEKAEEWDDFQCYEQFLTQTADADNLHYLSRGDEFTISNLSIKVFNAFDELTKEYGPDIGNDGSLVFKISGKSDSILFCGDCHDETMAEQLLALYGDELQAEYVQPGHHGNHSFPTSFYDVVDPKVAIFDAPEWLMTEDKFTARDLKAYFEGRGTAVYDFTTGPNSFTFK